MDRELDFVNDRDQTGSRFKELEVGPFNAFTPSQYSSSFVKFFVPASEVYNWSKSHLDLTLTFPASAGYSNYLFMGRNMLIQQMSLQYDGNNYPVNLSDCRIMSSVTTLPQLDYDDTYITRPQAVVAPSIAQLLGAARCELIQPIKKPSGTMDNEVVGSNMVVIVNPAAGANLGVAGTLCGYASGIPCYSTGVANAYAAVIATCNGFPVFSSVDAGVDPVVGQIMGTVAYGYPVVSNNAAIANNAVIGYVNGLTGIPLVSNGTAIAAGAILGTVLIGGVILPVISNNVAVGANAVIGYVVDAQKGAGQPDGQSPGGYSIALDQAVNGATTCPQALDGSDSVCTAIGSGVNTQMCIRIRINLSDFRNTLLAIDRTMCWPRNANLYVTFAPTQYWGYSIPAQSGPTIGAALLNSNSLLGVTVLQSVPTQQECMLRVAVEKSQPLRIASMAMTESGFSLNFPQVTTNAYPVQSNTMGTYSYNLESALGHSVLRIYTCVLNTDVGANYLSPSNYINYSSGTALVPNQYSTFQSWLGTELLQDQQLRPETCDDYRFLKRMLKGSAITSNLNFSNFSFFLDNFTGAGYTHKYDWANCDKGGLPLIDANGRTIQYNYRIQLTNTNGGRAQVWFIIVSQNTISISPMGVHIGAAAAR